MHIGLWDVLLLVVVSGMATTIAYIHNARVKALVLMLPVPFTLANLSLGRPVDATNVLGLPLLYLFTQAVRVLYRVAGVNIIAAIAASAVMYCLIGWGLAARVPKTELMFWIASGMVLLLGVGIHFAFRDVDEPGHESCLPVWQKASVIAVVVGMLVLIKAHLQGFMTLFPMVGVIAAYETRYSLSTTCRKVGQLMFTMLPMMAVMRIAQGRFGLSIGQSLVFGWITFLLCLVPLALDVRHKSRMSVTAQKQDSPVKMSAS